jgi:hypothetical protein
MIDRGVVEQQLRSIGEGPQWWDIREMRDLPNVLREHEQIIAMAHGRLSRIRRGWLVVVTNERLLLLRSFARAGWRHLEVDARSIERVALRIGPFRGRVLVVAGTKHKILMPRADAYRIHSALSSLAASQTSQPVFGRTHMVRRMFDHVLALPAVAFAPTSATAIATRHDPDVEQRLQLLEEQVGELQRQVEFLEDLLRRRHSVSPPEDAGHAV